MYISRGRYLTSAGRLWQRYHEFSRCKRAQQRIAKSDGGRENRFWGEGGGGVSGSGLLSRAVASEREREREWDARQRRKTGASETKAERRKGRAVTSRSFQGWPHPRREGEREREPVIAGAATSCPRQDHVTIHARFPLSHLRHCCVYIRLYYIYTRAILSNNPSRSNNEKSTATMYLPNCCTLPTIATACVCKFTFRLQVKT